jgi:hypothetical protein
MTDALRDLLANTAPGPISDPGDLERLLAACWPEFRGDDGGMTGQKLLGRMEDVVWHPPILSFTVERHGGTVQGSSRASLQQWRLDLDKKTAWCEERRFRQVRGRQPRLDVQALAEEVANAIRQRRGDGRLRWYEDGRVRVLIGKVLPKGSAVKRTLAERRKRFRQALRDRLAENRWEEVGPHSYMRRPTEHRQVFVKVGDFEAEVDEELAPLIKELARAGIVTVMSCQENRPGVAWIVFLSVEDLGAFLNIVAEYDPEEASFYRRATLDAEEGC